MGSSPLRKAEARAEGMAQGFPATDADACWQALHQGIVSLFFIPNSQPPKRRNPRAVQEPQAHPQAGTMGTGFPVTGKPRVACEVLEVRRPAGPPLGLASPVGKATAHRVPAGWARGGRPLPGVHAGCAHCFPFSFPSIQQEVHFNEKKHP